MKDKLCDLNDGKEWSDRDVENLHYAAEHGLSIEETARILCRGTAIDEVANKAAELGIELRYAVQNPHSLTLGSWLGPGAWKWKRS